jgi:NAD(P)H-hydrate epimerase
MSSGMLAQADEQASSRFGIDPIQLMEVAGWQIARVVDELVGGVRGKRVIVVAGAGNNGGDALVTARFLHQRGAFVRASMVFARDSNSLVARHARTVQGLGIATTQAPEGIDPSADVLVDGLFGIGIRLPLRDPAPRIIAAMHASHVPIVAIDVPSGLDADTGAGREAAVQAIATITLVAPKAGLRGATNAGRVVVADIGMPVAVFSAERAALAALYQLGDLIELVDPELNSAADAHRDITPS